MFTTFTVYCKCNLSHKIGVSSSTRHCLLHVKRRAETETSFLNNHFRVSTKLGSDVPCDSDKTCKTHFIDSLGLARYRFRFLALCVKFCSSSGLLQPSAPKDFNCDLSARRCVGLDSRLTLYALAKGEGGKNLTKKSFFSIRLFQSDFQFCGNRCLAWAST